MSEPARRLNLAAKGGGGDRPTGRHRGNPPVVFTREELNSLLRAASWDRNPTAVRDRALFAWCFWTAARVGELTTMLETGLDRARGRVRFARSKSDDIHEVPVPPEGWGDLDRWLALRRAQDARGGVLFPVSPYHVWRRMKLVGGWAGLPAAKCRPHVLRATRATLMLEDGASVEAVRLVLGHARLETTMGYLRATRGWYDSQAALGGL